MNGVVVVSFLYIPYMLGKFHSFRVCCVAEKEGLLKKSHCLKVPLLKPTRVDSSGLILACGRNLSALYDTGRKAIAV